jgi:hypothetical protein
LQIELLLYQQRAAALLWLPRNEHLKTLYQEFDVVLILELHFIGGLLENTEQLQCKWLQLLAINFLQESEAICEQIQSSRN